MPHNDLMDRLTAQHNHLRDQASALTGLQLGDERRRAVLDQLTADLLRHLRTEDAALYPLVRHLPGGAELAELETSTHASLEAVLGKLEDRPASAPDFDRLTAQLVELLTGHLGEEEATVFAFVRRAAPPRQLDRMGRRADRAYQRASVRPKHGPDVLLPPDDLLPPERGQWARAHEFFRPSSKGYQQPEYMQPAEHGGHVQRIRKHFSRAGDQRQ